MNQRSGDAYKFTCLVKIETLNMLKILIHNRTERNVFEKQNAVTNVLEKLADGTGPALGVTGKSR